MNEQLKPCPYCGSEARMGGSLHVGYWIACDDCELWMGYDATHGSESGIFVSCEEAIRAWNTRAAPAVKVRPLVWCSAAMGRQYGAGDGILYWINSACCVLFRTESGISAWQHLPSGAHPRASIEAAKAAAQSDYAARILAALE